jgi:hypothetical protein
MKGAFVQLGFLAACFVALTACLLFAASAQAQSSQVVDCSVAPGCNITADPPQDGSVTSCVLYGLPGAAVSKPIIDSASITVVPKPVGLKAKTCWWQAVVFPLGTYAAFAVVLAPDGRASGPSLPLTITPPTPPGPANLRVAQ